MEYLEERIPTPIGMDLEGRIWGLGPREKGELVRERGRERKRCNNIWEQSQDPKHVI